MSDIHEAAAALEQYAASPNTARAAPERSDQHAAKKTQRPTAARVDKPGSTLLAIVVDAATARVVRIESVDENGARRELASDERATLLKETVVGLEDLLQQAFEAGIACVLDGDAALETTPEPPEEAELRRRLLAPLIERSGVKPLMEPAALNRVILRTLIDHSTE